MDARYHHHHHHHQCKRVRKKDYIFVDRKTNYWNFIERRRHWVTQNTKHNARRRCVYLSIQLQMGVWKRSTPILSRGRWEITYTLLLMGTPLALPISNSTCFMIEFVFRVMGRYFSANTWHKAGQLVLSSTGRGRVHTTIPPNQKNDPFVPLTIILYEYIYVR